MRLIVVRERNDGGHPSRMDTLRYALSVDCLSRVILRGAFRFSCSIEDQNGFCRPTGWTAPENCVWAIPEHWYGNLSKVFGRTVKYTAPAAIDLSTLNDNGGSPWLVVSDGCYATHINGRLFSHVLAGIEADVVAVMAEPKLVAYRERIRLAQEGKLVGYRRLYRDSAEPIPMPSAWPHHLFIRQDCIRRIADGNLPCEFGDFMESVRSEGLTARAMAIAGSSVDLGTADGLLSLAETMSSCVSEAAASSGDGHEPSTSDTAAQGRISPEAQFVGPVVVGDGVCVDQGAVVVGPSILCDNSHIGANAVVDSSILGADVVLEEGRVLKRIFVVGPDAEVSTPGGQCALQGRPKSDWICPHSKGVFRSWSRFSYARCFKRIADFIVAGVVLILFAPIIPLIALAVKLNSPGPAFFTDKRQGLHGRPFDCIKFRTMHVGAADIQDKLRFVSEVDGPQFKMADDPRISTVGRFLRETYLDEIPQFYNVLCGQMSIVGPRPSPEKENTLCPSWRDARLSVRPGITGFWQVRRTRRPFKDFQEWIYYDTKYVRELSPWVDIKMCWLTFKKMVENFIRQF